MKKLITTLLLTLTICCCFSFLTACNHSHVFDKQVVSSEYKATDPTCEQKASYYFSCECGEKGSETFETGLLLNHVYENKFCTSCGEKEYSEGLEFRLINDDTEYEFIGLGTCADVEVVIPSTYNGKPVTSLAEYSFYYDYKTISVKIPNSVKNIGEHSFRFCFNLEEVWLSDNLESVGLYIFEDCPKLNYTEVDGLHYLGNGNNPYIYLMASTLSNQVTSVNLMDGCQIISKYVFHNYKNLKDVTFPKSLTIIQNYAFSGCPLIEQLNFEDYPNLRKLGDGAFRSVKLNTITIPATIKELGDWVFSYNPDAPLDINFLGTIEEWIELGAWELTSREYNLYINNEIVKNLEFSQEEVPANAFNDCLSIESVTFLDGVKSIGKGAFSDCKNLGKVIFSKTVESLGAYAFQRCNIYEITITENLKTFEPFYNSTQKKNEFKVFFTGNVEQWAKSGLSTLLDRTYNLYIENELVKDVDISNLTEIPSNAFCNCASLENVVFSDKTTSIGEKAFYSCFLLRNITVPSELTTIDDFAFYDCARLMSFNLPPKLTSIGNYAFYGCYSHFILTISNKIEYIGYSAFGWDTILSTNSTVNYLGTINKWLNLQLYQGFIDVKYNLSINDVPVVDLVLNNVEKIPEFAFQNCISLKTVKINDGTTHIEDSAFALCDNLTNVTISDSVVSIGNIFRNYYNYNNYTYTPVKINYLGKVEQWVKNALSENIYNQYELYFNGDLADKITISNIAEIPAGAFKNCISLYEVIIPSDVTSIGEDAFLGCINIRYVTVTKNLQSIGATAFYSSSNLYCITYNGTAEQWNKIHKGASWHYPFHKYTISRIECTDKDVSLGTN